MTLKHSFDLGELTVCTRFVDVEGQEDPVQYVIDTNKKIGMPRD